jgi:hypothetical protein
VPLNPSGGQFAVVALVAAACDALARLRHGKNQGHRVFELCLPPEWRPAARTLYRALRHGLIHAYEPKAVIVDGSPVTFEVAWQGHRHLTFPDENRDALCIVAPKLVDGLREAFAAVEAELRADQIARAAFLKRDRKERVVEQHGPAEQAAWRQAVGTAPIVPRPPQPPDLPGPHGPELAPGRRGSNRRAWPVRLVHEFFAPSLLVLSGLDVRLSCSPRPPTE